MYSLFLYGTIFSGVLGALPGTLLALSAVNVSGFLCDLLEASYPLRCSNAGWNGGFSIHFRTLFSTNPAARLRILLYPQRISPSLTAFPLLVLLCGFQRLFTFLFSFFFRPEKDPPCSPLAFFPPF